MTPEKKHKKIFHGKYIIIKRHNYSENEKKNEKIEKIKNLETKEYCLKYAVKGTLKPNFIIGVFSSLRPAEYGQKFNLI